MVFFIFKLLGEFEFEPASIQFELVLAGDEDHERAASAILIYEDSLDSEAIIFWDLFGGDQLRSFFSVIIKIPQSNFFWRCHNQLVVLVINMNRLRVSLELKQ